MFFTDHSEYWHVGQDFHLTISTSMSAYIYNHLSHLVVVIQQADVLLLYDCDKIGQLSRQFGASISEAVHAVLNVKPGLQIY